MQPGTGRIFINDVGTVTWEGINEGIAGANYGWPITEGPTTDPRFQSPLFAYGQSSGNITGCAISGGIFYNPETVQYPRGYVGDYFFTDFCDGWIQRLDLASGTVTEFVTDILLPVDLDVSSDGELHYLARGTGNNTGVVVKIRYGSNN